MAPLHKALQLRDHLPPREAMYLDGWAAEVEDIGRYLDFVLMLFLAFGLCFEVPVVLVILVALGVVTPEQLAGSRRYAIVGAFVVAAVLTPPDVLSQTMLAVPMCLLYEIGIFGARTLTRPPTADPAS